MDPLTGGLLSLGGGLLNNFFAGSRQQDAQNFAAQQVQQQESFQKDMRATAYQTAVEDMKKAGLNPMMAAGINTSVPSGASATGISAAPTSDPITPALNSAMNAAKVKNELETAVAQRDNIAKDTRLKVIQGNREDAETSKKLAEVPGAEAASKIVANHVAESVNERITAEKEQPYIASALKSVLAPTAKAAQDVYKLIPKFGININSARGAQRGWVGQNEIDTQNFNSRFNASFGN